MWQKIDESNRPTFLDEDDVGYFAREYTAGRDYSHSTANNLISNLKMKVEYRGTKRWYYRDQAIIKFADELDLIAPEEGWGNRWRVVAAPSSKTKDDPEYNDRLEAVVARWKAINRSVKSAEPIRTIASRAPLHFGEATRNPQHLYDSLEWTGVSDEEVTNFVIVDDLITCGTTFRACKKLIRENVPGAHVVGLFWSRCIWPDDA